jgi:hypothetical protein
VSGPLGPGPIANRTDTLPRVFLQIAQISSLLGRYVPCLLLVDMTSAENLRHFADTLPEIYASADFAERGAHRHAVVFGLLAVLISAMLTIGAIASLILAFG